MDKKKPVIGITTDIKDGHFLIEEKYARVIARAGGIPFLIPSIAGDTGLLGNTIAQIDGLLLPGSRDMDPKFYNEEPHPELRPMSMERTETEFSLLEAALRSGLPVLGICGGMQLINVFFGGSLYQDIYAYIKDALPHEKGAVHKIHVVSDSKLSLITGVSEFEVKSHHHQSVNRIGGDVRPCARTQDGIVEAIETVDESFVLGIQWHPELEYTNISEAIFESFINQCGKKIETG